MDALEFIEKRNQLCRDHEDCLNCPAHVNNNKYWCCLSCTSQLEAEEQVAIVEKWSKEHSTKTRESEFLKYGAVMKVKLDRGALAPTRAHKTDAGLDLRSPISVEVPARGSVVIDTGVHIELPNGTVGFLKSKSGLNVKHDITSEGVIDVGFTGSIKVKLYNHGTKPYTVLRGDRITQLVIFDCYFPDIESVNILETSERGENGFGSTGR